MNFGEEFITTNNGKKSRIKTTKGWKFLVKWIDGQKSWVQLKDIKYSYPIEVADYVVKYNLVEEPAFKWWLPHVMKKKVQIVSAIKSIMIKRTHKFGIEVPSTVTEALEMDKQNGNEFWRKAIDKITNIIVAFNILEDGESVPVGFEYLTVHLIFDVKMDLTRKSRLVADGHETPDPVGSTYAGVVSRESVRIALTYAELMGLDVWGAEIFKMLTCLLQHQKSSG